jgi:diguanylate cyclase (GGDEF)-like protein
MKNPLTTVIPLLSLRSVKLSIFAALGLLLVLLAWRSEDAASAKQSVSKTQALELARSAAVYQQAQLDQAQQLLHALSGISLVQKYDAAACNAFLARQLERFPQYQNLAFANTQGTVWCRAKALPEALVLPPLTTQQKPQLFVAQNKHLVFALPHFAANGRRQGAVLAMLPLQDFFPPLDASLPPASAFGLADAAGKLLAAFPAQSMPVGSTPADNAQYWYATQPVSGAADEMQLLLRLPVAASTWKTHWSLLLLLAVGSGLAAWRFGRWQPLSARVRQLYAQLHALVNTSRNTSGNTMLQRTPRLDPKPHGEPKSHSSTQQLRSAYTELKGAFVKKEERVRQLVHLDELSQRLQCCASSTELVDAVARCAQALFPECHGALFLRADIDHFGLALSWGDTTLTQSLQSLDCHALHSGRSYTSHGASASCCAHAKASGDYVCLPLQTASGPLGLLCLANLQGAGTKHTLPWAATAIAERTTIALAALRRQEQLQSRAIRDALTGLFNRGFMEEALAIEQRRALRRGSSIGVMMLDVDHFKRYNDSFGHAAGDALLRAIGGILQRTVREGDMPCRYGGEEFVVILPGADLANTRQRAEVLRLAIANWRPEPGDSALGSVTASIGVACFPGHGNTWQAALKRADEALYAAKDAGRNRVVVAAMQELEAAVTA